MTIFCVDWSKFPYHNISKTLWSLGYTPVKTVCSMSTVMPCVSQQTFPATICQHPFCTLFRKPFTNSKWNLLNDFLYLMPTIAFWTSLTVLLTFDLDLAFLLCSGITIKRIMSMPALTSAQCPMYSKGERTPIQPAFDSSYTLRSRTNTHSPFTQALGP